MKVTYKQTNNYLNKNDNEEICEIGQIARTVRRQLEGRRLLFGEYVRS